MAAAKRDKFEMVCYLLENGSNSDVISKTGLTALDYAILQGNYECAEEIYGRLKVTKPKSSYEYFDLAHKSKYRYVDYEIVVEGLEKGYSR